jgi:hypothetical protein
MPARFSHFLCALPKEMAKVAGFARENLANKEAIPTFESGNVEAWCALRLNTTVTGNGNLAWGRTAAIASICDHHQHVTLNMC